jgi:CHAD domain-containing protein
MVMIAARPEKWIEGTSPGGRITDAARRTLRVRLEAVRHYLPHTLEALAPAFPKELRTELYPVVETLQDKLGAINDHVTAVARLRRQLNTRGRGVTPSQRCVLDHEEDCLKQRRHDFSAWWTRARRDALWSAFAFLLCGRRKASPQSENPKPSERRSGDAA